MAITFTYTESTNIVDVTEGTSGTPATPTHFVTFDRAGTDTDLLVAGSPASDLALTYAVRPVEDLAILVKCIVANKTAEADFVFITGKDWRGAAQTESIDVTAGNGSYTSTKYWSEITTLDCSDNGAGGGNVWADGDLSVTQDIWGVIWDHGNGLFTVNCAIFNIGNGATSTYFKSTNEYVIFEDTITNKPYFIVTSNATLQMGNLSASGNYGTDGSVFYQKCTAGAGQSQDHDGILKMYDSKWSGTPGQARYLPEVRHADSEFYDSVITALHFIEFKASVTYKRTQIVDMTSSSAPGVVTIAGATFSDCVIIDPPTGANAIAYGLYANANLVRPMIDGTPGWSWYADLSNDVTINTPGSGFDVSDGKWATGLGDANEKYPIDIHVANGAGANLSGVTVLLEDVGSVQVFSVVTAADGTITQQTVIASRWYKGGGGNNTEDAKDPMTMTLSKAGYETLVLDNITVDGHIVWHLELQAQKQPPAPWQKGMM